MGAQKAKKYDKAKTPYQRVLESEEVSEEIKERLRKRYVTLNPIKLRNEIERRLERIFSSVMKKYQISEMEEAEAQEAVMGGMDYGEIVDCMASESFVFWRGSRY